MTTETISTGRSLLYSIISAIGEAYVSFAKRSPTAECAAEAQRLFALSDEELALMGLTRRTVLPHAFRHYVNL